MFFFFWILFSNRLHVFWVYGTFERHVHKPQQFNDCTHRHSKNTHAHKLLALNSWFCRLSVRCKYVFFYLLFVSSSSNQFQSINVIFGLCIQYNMFVCFCFCFYLKIDQFKQGHRPIIIMIVRMHTSTPKITATKTTMITSAHRLP